MNETINYRANLAIKEFAHAHKLQTTAGVALYAARKAIVEPVFGQWERRFNSPPSAPLLNGSLP